MRPETFFDQLADVLDTVAPLPGEDSLYGQFAALLAAGQADSAIEDLMIDAATALDQTLISDFMRWEYNGKPAGRGWNRSLHNAAWGLDYYNRTGSARSNMFDNRALETQYYYSDTDSAGRQLDGDTGCEITFAVGELPPVEGFWSLTLYDEQHFFYANDLRRYSLGTKNTSLQYGQDGSLTLHAGSRSPGAEHESNWLPAPSGPFSLYLRAYWPKPAIIDGTWTPPEVTAA